MVNKCSVVGCNSNYKSGEQAPVFGFPKDEDMKKLWVKFINRKDWSVTKTSFICIKHFESKYIKKGASGKRFRLNNELKPVPTIYPESIKSASLSIVVEPRKSPTKRIFQRDELNEFLDKDIIKDLYSLSSTDSPGYLFTKHDECVVFYKLILNELKVPQVAEVIRIDKDLHVKLFYKNLPVSLPPWLRVTHQCKLKRRSMLDNIPSHFSTEIEQLSSILEELCISLKRKQVFSPTMIHFALMLR